MGLVIKAEEVEKYRTCCISCKHFYFEPAGLDYSDQTPGSKMDIGCSMNRWLPNALNDEITFQVQMRRAVFCLDFEFGHDIRVEDKSLIHGEFDDCKATEADVELFDQDAGIYHCKLCDRFWKKK